MSHELILEGTLGVDARRAAKKIRDHLLANPATWLSELGRVAVLSGASRLAVDLRATSIVVEWNGAPIDVEVIEQFGRHLLGGDDTLPLPKRSRHTKPDRRPGLLTLAVFAALGDVARAVDINLVGEEGTAKIRRMTREDLEGDLTAGKARVSSVRRDDAFGLLPDATGGLVLDLGARLGALAHWVGLAARPAAVRELGMRMGTGLAISVDGKSLEPAADEPVLSVELPAVGDLAIRVDLLERPPREPRIVYYELGFEIARASLLEPTLELPIRVVVSGAEVPTNASRSQVDETVAAHVRREVLAELPVACERLRAAIVSALGRNDEKARSALEQVAGFLAAAALRANPLDPFFKAFAPTLDWPLLCDAAGRPLSVRDAHRRADGYAIHCRVQRQPLEPEYAPLVADVLWRRGRSAESAFTLLDYDIIAEDVDAGLLRKRQLAENAVAFEPPPCATARSRHRGVEEGACEWQLTLDTSSTGPSLLRLFAGDDLIETREMDSPSPFFRYDAAMRWPGVVVPERTLQKMRAGDGSARMLAVLERVVKESLLKSLETSAVKAPGPARSLALRMISPGLDRAPELTSLLLWQRAGAGFASTAELDASAKQRGHLFVISRALLERETAPKEPVVVVADGEAPHLRAALRDAPLVDYAPYAGAPMADVETVKRYFADAKLASHSFKWREYFLSVTPAARGRHVSLHRGLLVADVELDAKRGMMVATDGETTLRQSADEHAEMVEHAWQSMISWLAGDAGRMASALTAPGVRAALRGKISGHRKKKAQPQVPFEEWPLFRLHTSLRAERDASAAEIVAHFGEGGTLPTVFPGEPYDSTIDCVVASEKERVLLERLAKRSCIPPHRSQRPEPQEAAFDVESRPTAGVGADDDVLSALREILPNVGTAEVARPAKASPPLPVAPRTAKKLPRPSAPETPPPASPAPADPDDILGPIRHLMRQSVERQAAEEKARSAERARAEARAAETASALAAIDTKVSKATGDLPKPREPETAWEKLVGLFQKPLLEVPSGHPLATLSRRVTQSLYVENLQLRFSEPGEAAVRFDKRATTLVVNPQHPTVRVLIESGDVVPLVAAAFSEINRELKIVSDDEERRALGRLLLDPPSG